MNPAESTNVTNNTSASQTPPAASSHQPKVKGSDNGLKLFMVLLIVLLLGGIGFVSYELFLKNTQLQALQQQQQKTEQTVQVQVPKDAVAITGCLPYMGIHWVRPQDIPHGPYYVTYNGKVTAVEYMFKPDEIPDREIAQASASAFMQYMQTHTFGQLTHPNFPFDLSSVSGIKYMNISWTPPHAGFLVPHYDVHFYLISREETEKICPNAKLEEAQTPLIEQQLQKYNIPYIPVEGPAQGGSQGQGQSGVGQTSNTTVNNAVNSTAPGATTNSTAK